jgi:cytochrome b pre-mRNA-processing protein 3
MEMGWMAGLWRRLFGRDERDALAPLYRAVVAEARRPDWYRIGRVPDTLDGRFDMVAMVMSLTLLRLEEVGEAGRASAVQLTELFVEDMDGQLRERGIGDIVVGKHVGKMMGALGGRLRALRDGFAADALDEVIERNVYRGAPPAEEAQRFVRDGLLGLRARLAATPADALITGDWPA